MVFKNPFLTLKIIKFTYNYILKGGVSSIVNLVLGQKMCKQIIDVFNHAKYLVP